MYVSLSIMKPSEGHEQDPIGSMHRFSEAARSQPGLKFITTLQDPGSRDLFGIAVWESREAAEAGNPATMAAVAGDDLGTWAVSMQNFRLEEV